jgi:hypothetical protein
MRDLYHRKQKLEHWTNRVKADLQEADKTDILKFIQYMLDKERSVLWIIRCITALLLIRRQFGKCFRDPSKEDIRSLFRWTIKTTKDRHMKNLEQFSSFIIR